MKRRAQSGATLIELMVALAIGMVLSLAVFSVMSTFEGQRRRLRAGSDLDQAGGLAMFQIDQWVRSAGSGLTQASLYTYGCTLKAAKSGAQLLPALSTLPAPFASVNPGSSGVFRLAPAMILPGQTTPGASGTSSDVLVLMSSGSNNGEVPSLFSGAATTGQVTLANTMPFAGGDMVLLANSDVGAGVASCMVTQAASTFTGTNSATVVANMPLAGTWYQATVNSTSVTDYPNGTGLAIDLGSPTSPTPPSFQIVGVGDNNTLYSYDLLNITGTPLQARADSVFELHALYGVDTDNDGKVDSWVNASSGSYTVANLTDGSVNASLRIKSIKSLRVGLILRTALPEKDPIPTPPLTLFSDLGTSLTYTRTIATSEQNFRYRTVEATIPLRNNSF
jgi:type IV pilus assembly protein PilW